MKRDILLRNSWISIIVGGFFVGCLAIFLGSSTSLLLLGSIIVVAIAFKKTSWLPYILIMAAPLFIYQMETPLKFHVTLFRLTFILTTMTMLVKVLGLLTNSDKLHRFITRNKVMLLFVLAILVTYTLSYVRASRGMHHQATYAYFADLMFFLTILYFSYIISSKRRLLRGIWTYVFSSTIPMGVALYISISRMISKVAMKVPLSSLVSHEKLVYKTTRVSPEFSFIPRAEGTLGDANLLAYYLVIILTLMLCVLHQKQNPRWVKRYSTFLHLLAYTVLFSLFITFSRSGFAVLAISQLFLFIVSYDASFRRKLAHFWLRAITMVLFISLAMGISGFNPVEPFLSRGMDPGRTRIPRVMAGLAAFYHNPVVGVGLANIGPLYKEMYDDPKPLSKINPSSHSFYVTTLGESGLWGFLVITGFFIYLIRMVQMGENSLVKTGLLACAVGLLASQVVYDNLLHPIFAVFWGLVAAYGTNLKA